MTARDFNARGLVAVPRAGLSPNVGCRRCHVSGVRKVAPDLCENCAPPSLRPRTPFAGIPAAALLPDELEARAILPDAALPGEIEAAP